MYNGTIQHLVNLNTAVWLVVSFQNQYIKHKEIYGAQGLKILAKDLEKALAGLPVLVAEHPDEVEILKVCPIFFLAFKSSFLLTFRFQKANSVSCLMHAQ